MYPCIGQWGRPSSFVAPSGSYCIIVIIMLTSVFCVVAYSHLALLIIVNQKMCFVYTDVCKALKALKLYTRPKCLWSFFENNSTCIVRAGLEPKTPGIPATRPPRLPSCYKYIIGSLYLCSRFHETRLLKDNGHNW